MRKSNAWLPLVGVAILLAVWGLVAALKLVDPVLLPSPLATFRSALPKNSIARWNS